MASLRETMVNQLPALDEGFPLFPVCIFVLVLQQLFTEPAANPKRILLNPACKHKHLANPYVQLS